MQRKRNRGIQSKEDGGKNMTAREFFKSYGPEVGIVGGIAGMWVAAGLSIFTTVKVVRKLDKAREEKGEELTLKEKAAIIVPRFVGPAIIAIGSTVAVAVGTKAELGRTAVLASLATFTERALLAQEEASKNVVGEEKATDIKKQATKELIKRECAEGPLRIEQVKNYETVFCDTYLLGSYCFTGDWQTIRSRAVDIGVELARDINDKVTAREYVEYVYQLDTNRIKVPECLDLLGWCVGSNAPRPDIISDVDEDSVCDDGTVVHYITHDTKPVSLDSFRRFY